MEIITTPDPRLRERSTKADPNDPEVVKTIAAMRENCLSWEADHKFELSAAMAAPQLGINKRIIIVRDDFDDKNNNYFTALLNPKVLQTSGKIIKDYEGCLSVPYLYGLVPRPEKAKISAQLEDGTPVRIKADKFLARTLLHEIDHLNGVLFIDHIKDDRDAFYKMNDEGEIEPLDYDKYIKNNHELFPDD